MQEYIDISMRFMSDFQSWNAPRLMAAMVLGFSTLAAVIMTRFIKAAPLFSGPICFIVLSQAAFLANFLGRSQTMMGTNEVDKILFYTVLGQAPASLALFLAFRANSKGLRR
jgi:hypothetical protein